jgi:hypothetical protein
MSIGTPIPESKVIELNSKPGMFLHGLCYEDQQIWLKLCCGQQYLDDRCTALAARGIDRTVRNRLLPRDRTAARLHIVDRATQGMDEDDSTEIYYARKDNREPEFI